MVRIFPVKELEERRRVLTQRSEAYRRLIRVEVEGVSDALTRFKNKLEPARGIWRVLNVISPIAGLFSGRGKRHGFFSRLLSGISFATEILGALKKPNSPAADTAEEDTPRTAF